MMVQFHRFKAIARHSFQALRYTQMIEDEALRNNTPSAEDFLKGAQQAFVHVNKGLVAKSDITDMRSCFTQKVWEDVQKISKTLDDRRAEYGDLYKLDFYNVEPFISDCELDAEGKKMTVDIEFFSEYSFRFEPEDRATSLRRSKFSFLLEFNDPTWRIQNTVSYDQE